MKILLLGGTGAMGVHLAECLAASNENQIYITSRRPRKSEKTNCHYVLGNAHSLSFLQEILAEPWDVIVDFMVYTTKEFQGRAELLLSKTRQYVFISSARVYANSADPITENSPRLLDVCSDSEYLATDEYALTKARQEDILKAQSSTNWTIIRPYITFSEQRLQLGVLEKESWLYRAVNGKRIIFSEDIAEKRTTLTHGKDVAKGITAILGKIDTLGQTFHITQSKTYTWNEILMIYLDVLEDELKRRPDVLMTKSASALKGNGRYQVKYDRLFNRSFDNSSIGKYIDVSTFSDPKEELGKCLRDFLQKGKFLPLSWSIVAEQDRQAGEKSKIQEMGSVRNIAIYYLFRYFRFVGVALQKIKYK